METLAAEPSDVLFLLAEVAVAFAGFAGVVAIFQARLSQDAPSFDLFRFWVMLASSLSLLGFSLLPLVFHFLGSSQSAVWRLSSLVLAVFTVANAIFIVRLIRSRVEAVVASLDPAITVAANVTYAITLITQIANVFGALGGPRFGLYLVGLLMVLLGAAVNFARLVWVGTSRLRPPAG